MADEPGEVDVEALQGKHTGAGPVDIADPLMAMPGILLERAAARNEPAEP